SLELAEASAQEHHPVRVVYPAVLSNDVRRPAAVLGDEDRPCAPDGLHLAWRPVHDLRVENVPRRLHLRMGRIDRDVPVAGRLVRRLYVPTGLVDIDTDEIEWRGDRLQFRLGELRRPTARCGQIRVGVSPFEHDRHEAGIALARSRLRGFDVLWRVDDRNGEADILGEADLCAGRSTGPDGLDGEAVAEHGVVPDLLQ